MENTQTRSDKNHIQLQILGKHFVNYVEIEAIG